MPNWCDNELVISGERDELEKFKEEAAGENGCLDMENFKPYPEIFKQQDVIATEHNNKLRNELDNMNDNEMKEYLKNHPFMKDGYSSGGYKWCCNNWGTKWNFCEPRLEWEDDDSLFYIFGTAWSPPNPIIIEMSKKFPELTFELRYFEAAMEFNGHLIVEEGEIESHNKGDYFGHRGG